MCSRVQADLLTRAGSLALPRLILRVAKRLQIALLAFWIARDAYLTAVMDHLV